MYIQVSIPSIGWKEFTNRTYSVHVRQTGFPLSYKVAYMKTDGIHLFSAHRYYKEDQLLLHEANCLVPYDEARNLVEEDYKEIIEYLVWSGQMSYPIPPTICKRLEGDDFPNAEWT